MRVIALGAGVQSTTLYLLAHHGEIGPRPDYAIFADTQQEPPWVYENLDRLDALGSIPIVRATVGDIGEAVRTSMNTSGGRFTSVPFWTRGQDGREAPGRRQCTREFKIDVVKKETRRLLGLKKGERIKKGVEVEEWVGISTDEAHRAKPSRYPYIKTRWPLLFDKPMRRQDCEQYLDSIGYPRPGKSACVFCPYRRATEYARWKREHPKLFEEACRWDETIREGGLGLAGQQFVLRQLVPLREIDSVVDDGRDLFGNECEGMCGV